MQELHLIVRFPPRKAGVAGWALLVLLLAACQSQAPDAVQKAPSIGIELAAQGSFPALEFRRPPRRWAVFSPAVWRMQQELDLVGRTVALGGTADYGPLPEDALWLNPDLPLDTAALAQTQPELLFLQARSPGLDSSTHSLLQHWAQQAGVPLVPVSIDKPADYLHLLHLAGALGGKPQQAEALQRRHRQVRQRLRTYFAGEVRRRVVFLRSAEPPVLLAGGHWANAWLADLNVENPAAALGPGHWVQAPPQELQRLDPDQVVLAHPEASQLDRLLDRHPQLMRMRALQQPTVYQLQQPELLHSPQWSPQRVLADLLYATRSGAPVELLLDPDTPLKEVRQHDSAPDSTDSKVQQQPVRAF